MLYTISREKILFQQMKIRNFILILKKIKRKTLKVCINDRLIEILFCSKETESNFSSESH